MAYMALYRQWRPQTFGAVVGQEHITRTLRNALLQGQLAHAYLFCGPRGTGKTSIAKLLAKAVNCTDSRDAEPCNACSNCQRINEGRAVDVLEIDAASNRGIDEIRDLKDKVKYAPAECRRKVYIIDEVHMLTNEAFNALLKTLEEPPDHVLFLLATTEAHRVPATILSRCQRFDFHRFGVDEIVGRLREVVQQQGIDADDAALLAIARWAEGGLRDALSLLDQVLAFATGRISAADVAAVLGSAPLDALRRVVEALATGDTALALQMVDELSRQGKDLKQFLKDLMVLVRHLLLHRAGAEQASTAGLAPDEARVLRELAPRFTAERLTEILKRLAEVDAELRWATQPRLLIELALVRLLVDVAVAASAASAAAPPAVTPVPGRQAAPPLAPTPTVSPSAASTSPPASAREAVGQPAASPERGGRAGSLDLATVQQRWPELLERLKGPHVRIQGLLQQARPASWDGKTLVIEFPPGYSILRDRVAKDENRAVIGNLFQEMFGCPAAIQAVVQDAAAAPAQAAGAGPRAPDVVADPRVQRVLELFGGEIIEVRED